MASGQEKPAKLKSKSAFIRSQPDHLPAKEVVERAKKMGWSIGEKYVYVIRSSARKKAGKRKLGRPPGSAAPSAAGTASEREFRRLALQLGLKRADELLSDTKKKSADLISGK